MAGLGGATGATGFAGIARAFSRSRASLRYDLITTVLLNVCRFCSLSGLNIVLSARAIPWLTAPAWPVMPPPFVLTNTSTRLSCSVTFSGPSTAARSLSSVKY